MKTYRPRCCGAALFAVLVVLQACEQDPLRIPHMGDGGAWDADEDRMIAPDIPLPDAQPDLRADLSYDACIAQLEVCNNADDNCNGQLDEGYDKLGDARFCEECKGCKDLLAKNAIPGCTAGKCVIRSCVSGYEDANGDPADGCEYLCTPSGVEVCDGNDNDCNGSVDDGVVLTQNICKDLGACQGATAQCKGAAGWVCQYGADVELQPCTQDAECGAGNKCVSNKCPNLVIVNEQRCDGKDGDCDGLADDPWVNPTLPEPLGGECDPSSAKSCTGDPQCDPATGSTCQGGFCTPKKGICKDVGIVQCKADGTGKECVLKSNGQSPGTETCNGVDDDCDGVVDDNVSDEQWVDVGVVKIFKYEASRPDGTAAAAGILTNGRPCSVPGRLPWAQVSSTEAQAACARIGGGARLCSKAEWIEACQGQANYTYPYGNTYDATKCNGRAYNATVDVVLPTDQPAACLSDWGAAGALLNMSGNVKEWVSASGGFEIRGGAFDTPSIPDGSGGLSCLYDLPAPATTLRLPTTGFRCCKP